MTSTTKHKLNEWIPAVLLRKKDGSFHLCNSLRSVREIQDQFTGEYQEVAFNWNHGQPLVRLSNGETVSIVDMDYGS